MRKGLIIEYIYGKWTTQTYSNIFEILRHYQLTKIMKNNVKNKKKV